MSTKKPNEREKMRAVRYLRHLENCLECRPDSGHYCMVAYGHFRRWVTAYYREALGTCRHYQEGECWEDRCRGGKKAHSG